MQSHLWMKRWGVIEGWAYLCCSPASVSPMTPLSAPLAPSLPLSLTRSLSPKDSAEEMADLSVSADRSVLGGREWAFLLRHLHAQKLAQKRAKRGLLSGFLQRLIFLCFLTTLLFFAPFIVLFHILHLGPPWRGSRHSRRVRMLVQPRWSTHHRHNQWTSRLKAARWVCLFQQHSIFFLSLFTFSNSERPEYVWIPKIFSSCFSLLLLLTAQLVSVVMQVNMCYALALGFSSVNLAIRNYLPLAACGFKVFVSVFMFLFLSLPSCLCSLPRSPPLSLPQGLVLPITR